MSIVTRLDPNLSWARTSYKSVRGQIATNWTRNDAFLTLDVTIPANTTAMISVVPDQARRPVLFGKGEHPVEYVVAQTIKGQGWFRHGSKAGHTSAVAGVDARRATPPGPRLARWGLAGCRQLDPSHPGLITSEDAEFEPRREVLSAPKVASPTISAGAASLAAGRVEPVAGTLWSRALIPPRHAGKHD